MKWLLVACVMWAGVAAGQENRPPPVDPDVYKAAADRLAAKAATQPTELDRLRKENAELKRENADLRARIASLENAAPKNATPPAGLNPEEVLKIGMTVEEASKAIGSRGIVDSETTAEKTLRFVQRKVDADRTIFATFTDGKLSTVQYQGWNVMPSAPPAPVLGERRGEPNPRKPKTPGGY